MLKNWSKSIFYNTNVILKKIYIFKISKYVEYLEDISVSYWQMVILKEIFFLTNRIIQVSQESLSNMLRTSETIWVGVEMFFLADILSLFSSGSDTTCHLGWDRAIVQFKREPNFIVIKEFPSSGKFTCGSAEKKIEFIWVLGRVWMEETFLLHNNKNVLFTWHEISIHLPMMWNNFKQQ